MPELPDEELYGGRQLRQANLFETLTAVHDHHRVLCSVVESAADDVLFPSDLFDRVQLFAKSVLAPHLEFDRDHLFPLLRRRMAADASFLDGLSNIESLQRRTSRWCKRLDRIAVARSPAALQLSERRRRQIKTYAHRQAASLAYENAVVLKIASAVLRKQDREWLELVSGQSAVNRPISVRKKDSTKDD